MRVMLSTWRVFTNMSNNTATKMAHHGRNLDAMDEERAADHMEALFAPPYLPRAGEWVEVVEIHPKEREYCERYPDRKELPDIGETRKVANTSARASPGGFYGPGWVMLSFNGYAGILVCRVRQRKAQV